MSEAPDQAPSTQAPSTAAGGALMRIRMAADGGPIGRGGSGARYITAEDGSKWVMKATFLGGQAHEYLCLNEGLAAQIGWRLGVAVPSAAVLELTTDQLQNFSATAPETARFVFASRLVEPAEPLTPESASESSPRDRAGIVVFDELIWNSDRNPEHVLAEPVDDGAWALHPIDHGHSFAVADTLASNLDPARQVPAPIPLLTEGLAVSDAEPFIAVAEGITRREYYEMVRDLPGPWVVEPDAPDLLADALHGRAKQVAASVSNHLSRV